MPDVSGLGAGLTCPHLPSGRRSHDLCVLQVALAGMHARSLVHTDLKPDNILLKAVPGVPAGGSKCPSSVVYC